VHYFEVFAAIQLHKAKALTTTAISLVRNSIEMVLPTCLLRAAAVACLLRHDPTPEVTLGRLLTVYLHIKTALA
jgi:hypothetical protein